MVNRGPSVVSDRYRTRLRYCDGFLLTGGGGTPASYIFRGNSIYDPNFTAAGHQPKGLTELSNLYKKYKVTDTRFRVTATNSSGFPATLVVWPSRDNVVSSIIYQSAIENPRSSYVQLAMNGAKTSHVNRKFQSIEILGLQKLVDEDNGALVTNNPNNTWYIKMLTQSTALTNTVTVECVVEIEFDVVFYEKQTLPYA